MAIQPHATVLIMKRKANTKKNEPLKKHLRFSFQQKVVALNSHLSESLKIPFGSCSHIPLRI